MKSGRFYAPKLAQRTGVHKITRQCEWPNCLKDSQKKAGDCDYCFDHAYYVEMNRIAAANGQFIIKEV